jgi:adenosylcobyric acid synthase
VYQNGAEAFATIVREGQRQPTADGAVAASGRVWGTYVHGLFDDDAFRHSFLDTAREACGLAPAPRHAFVTAERQARIDRWADHLRQSLKLDLIRGWAGGSA